MYFGGSCIKLLFWLIMLESIIIIGGGGGRGKGNFSFFMYDFKFKGLLLIYLKIGDLKRFLCFKL